MAHGRRLMPSDVWYTWIPLLLTVLLLIGIVVSVVFLIVSLFGRARRGRAARLALGVYSLIFGGALLMATYLTFGGAGLTSNDLAVFPELWSAGTILLGLVLIAGGLVALRKSARRGVGRPLLFAVAGAALNVLVLVIRGPDDWRAIPLGEDVVGVAIVIGIVVYVLSRRTANARGE
jgi:hypothetical protein